MKKILLVALVFSASLTFGVTHYVDYTTGLDTNNGTSTSTPWKHVPGQQGLTPSGSSTGDACSNNCASYTPAAGDFIILKGGTTWPYDIAGQIRNNSGWGSAGAFAQEKLLTPVFGW